MLKDVDCMVRHGRQHPVQIRFAELRSPLKTLTTEALIIHPQNKDLTYFLD